MNAQAAHGAATRQANKYDLWHNPSHYDGKYKAADRLPSGPELCRLFRVGRGAVREALKALAMRGMVRVERGTFVGKRSEFLVAPLRLGLMAGAELQSLIEARQLIEVELAGLAARALDQTSRLPPALIIPK